MLKYKHGNNIQEQKKKNSKTSESHKFLLNLSQRFDIKSCYKHVALQIYLLHMEKYKKNNKLKIVTRTWNNKFE